MNFKEWLKISEVAVRVRPSKTPSQSGGAPPVADRGSLYGLAGTAGHAGTQLPISKGWNNQATAGFLSGIGSGVSKAQLDSGFEARPIPQIADLPTWQKPHVEHGNLPLQLPAIVTGDKPNDLQWLPGFEQDKLTSYDVDMAQQVYKQVRHPDSDLRVLKTNDDQGKDKFKSLSSFSSEYQNEFLGKAKNFTRALIKISIINEMMENGMDQKFNLAKGQLGKEHVENNTLICVFYFEPYKTVDQEVE